MSGWMGGIDFKTRMTASDAGLLLRTIHALLKCNAALVRPQPLLNCTFLWSVSVVTYYICKIFSFDSRLSSAFDYNLSWTPWFETLLMVEYFFLTTNHHLAASRSSRVLVRQKEQNRRKSWLRLRFSRVMPPKVHIYWTDGRTTNFGHMIDFFLAFCPSFFVGD